MAKGNGDSNRRDDAARAGWLYYVAGNTQDEIARKLGVSRQSAQRLVSMAVSEKLIKFRLDHPIANCLDLSAQLSDRFALDLCEVVPTDPEAPGATTGIAIAGAQIMQKWLEREEKLVIGLGTGRVLRACVEQLPQMECPQHHLVSLVGNMMTDGSATAFNVVVRMAERVGTGHNPMPLTVLARTPEELWMLHAQEPVAHTLDLCRDADVTFVGVGHIDDTAPLAVDGVITHDESRALIDQGAVGEVVGWVINAQGGLIQGLTNSLVTSAPLMPKNPRPVIGLAVGDHKVAAILAALRGYLINGLVTDEATAKAILSHA